jgi:hypothetical protein
VSGGSLAGGALDAPARRSPKPHCFRFGVYGSSKQRSAYWIRMNGGACPYRSSTSTQYAVAWIKSPSKGWCRGARVFLRSTGIRSPDSMRTSASGLPFYPYRCDTSTGQSRQPAETALAACPHKNKRGSQEQNGGDEYRHHRHLLSIHALRSRSAMPARARMTAHQRAPDCFPGWPPRRAPHEVQSPRRAAIPPAPIPGVPDGSETRHARKTGIHAIRWR